MHAAALMHAANKWISNKTNGRFIFWITTHFITVFPRNKLLLIMHRPKANILIQQVL